MNSRIEDFVRDHREEFDGEEPDKKIWEKIAADLEPRKKKQGILVGIGRAGWIAAAAVVLLAVGMVWVFSARSGHDAPAVASQATNHLPAQAAAVTKTEPTTPVKETVDSANATTKAAPQPTLATIRPKDNNQNQAKVDELENSMDEEMYHYAKLVEIKHKQLKSLEKDEPLLYKQFASDVSKLDSVYRNLQSQLPKNPNREQLLEAMLQNLQLQMGLLNHQLDIIKQINHSKKTAYEQAYKTA
jgi:chemotaxis protein histidine kinase CheA